MFFSSESTSKLGKNRKLKRREKEKAISHRNTQTIKKASYAASFYFAWKHSNNKESILCVFKCGYFLHRIGITE